MLPPGVRSALHQVKTKVEDFVVQDCPPELSACEVCDLHECQNSQWLNCEDRLAAAVHLLAGDRSGLERLQRGCQVDGGGCLRALPDLPSS